MIFDIQISLKIFLRLFNNLLHLSLNYYYKFIKFIIVNLIKCHLYVISQIKNFLKFLHFH